MRVRTGYSFRAAVGHLEEVINRLQAIDYPAAPISDRCSTFGFSKWDKLTRKAGLRPVFGVELAVVPELGQKRPVVDHWSFFAKESLRPLHDLIAKATSNHGKEPSVLYGQALAAAGLIKVAGARVLINKVPTDSTDFYVALSPSTPKFLYTAATRNGFRMVASSDNYHTLRSDLEFYRVALGSRSSTQTYPTHILSDQEWRDSVAWFADEDVVTRALATRNDLLAACRAEIIKADLLVPAKPKSLRQMCQEGAEIRGINLSDQIYSSRLDRELSIIAEKKFEDYFYILADMVAWARERMVVGPARGSSCGSLVCYLIGITAIDPIPFKLVFERFIDVTRADLPDIDVDFSDANRHLVFEYAEQKYGKDRVARLGSVGTFQPASVFNRLSDALRIPSHEIEKVTNSLIKRSRGDSRASQTIEDTFNDTEAGKELVRDHPEVKIAFRLEDHPTNAGQHAAGVVITNTPVADHVAVDMRTGAIMADKKDAEELGLLKIDALGLTQLSTFERTMELIGKRPVSGWLETLPIDDQSAFDVLNRKHFAGVFQFIGKSVRSLAEEIKIDRFGDLADITALARPGPIGGGGADDWVARRTGKRPVTYVHQAFEPYLKDTYGVVVYQEQVLAIGREIGDLSWEEVTGLRKAMSRSLGKEYFDANGGNKWKDVATAKGIPRETAEKMWDEICSFGLWAFNLAHSVAYGMVSYWCCWLKAHHPLEFAAATLDAESDPTRQVTVLRELAEEGVEYLPVDPNLSTDRWTVQRGDRPRLIGPLTAIKGIGPANVLTILDARKNGVELTPGLRKKLESPKTEIDSLYPISKAASPLMEKKKIETPRWDIKDVQPSVAQEVMIVGVVTKINPSNENAPIKVARRNGQKVYPEMALNMFVKDDTDEIFCKVHRNSYERIGKEIAAESRVGKSIYAIKGRPQAGDFRMIWVRAVRYLGEIDGKEKNPVLEQSG